MACAPISWREGNQSFPPRKSASLNAKNTSSSVLKCLYLPPNEDLGTEGGGQSELFRTRVHNAGFHPAWWSLSSLSELTPSTWQPIGHCPYCCLFCWAMDLQDVHTCPSPSLTSRKAPTALNDQALEKCFSQWRGREAGWPKRCLVYWIFFFGHLAAHGVLGWGSDQSHGCDLYLSCPSTGSLTHHAEPGIKTAS